MLKQSSPAAGSVAASQGTPLLEVKGVTKRFPGVTALCDVSFRLERGEVLAVIGENGAGKSTLMKILGGVHAPDAGEIVLDGEPVAIDTVQAATALGIAFVHQELNNSDNLDIASNIFLGREPLANAALGFIDRRKLYRDADAILARIGMDCPSRTLVRDLAIGSQQMVEIAKAISIDARILIMDEPTSSISQHETAQLFKVIREMQARGISIIYISHRLGEIEAIADRVLVLRDGVVSGHLERHEIEYNAMIKPMIGRDLESFYHLEHTVSREPMLEVRDLLVPGHPTLPLSFTLYAGEILVFAGLVGAGRTELLHALFGVDQPLGGQILLGGQPVTIRDPEDAIRAGIALVPEDRKLNGLFLEKAIEFNLTIAGLKQHQRMRLIQFGQCAAITSEMVKTLNIRSQDSQQLAQTLSGGNQQKVVLGKWLSLHPKVLLMDEPTRGIDVAAKMEIYRLMEALAKTGVSILVASSEMLEVVGIADRVIVMCEGRISGECRTKDEINEESIVQLSTRGN
jgi:ribose transport system ATP-binding protein